MKRATIFIGLFCIVVGGGCLLFVNYHTKTLSDIALAHNAPPDTASLATKIKNVTSTTYYPATTTKISAATIAATTPTSTAMNFEIVTTQAAQEQGLGGRAVIPDNYAMLFVFPVDGSYGFWMKDMLTSIDMIWLTDNGTIAGIQEDATPESYPDVFYPPHPIRYVLETRVGLAKEKGWTIGTKIALPLPYGK